MFAPVLTLAITLAQAGGGSTSTDHGLWLIWGIVLIAVGIALFLVEVLVPSAGIIALVATGCVIAGVVLLFRVDTLFGLIGAIVAVAALPFVFAAAIKLWPDTPIGRLLILKSPPSKPPTGDTHTEQAGGSNTARAHPALAAGDRGRALTSLRPVGTVLFDHQREECLAVGGVIDSGAQVVITNIDGRHIKVKVVSTGQSD